MVGVCFFLIKGYSGKGAVATQVLPTQNPSASISPDNDKENVTSTKISLLITSPKNGDTLDSTNASVKGKTTPNAEVFVNDVMGKADLNGNFSISIGLDEGTNVIVVSVNDADGNVSEQTINVTVASFE